MGVPEGEELERDQKTYPKKLTVKNPSNVLIVQPPAPPARSSMKIKTRRKSWKQQEKGDSFVLMCPNRKIAGFLLDTPEATRQHYATFKVLKGKRKVLKKKRKKKLSTKNLISRKSVFQKWRWNKYILR